MGPIGEASLFSLIVRLRGVANMAHHLLGSVLVVSALRAVSKLNIHSYVGLSNYIKYII
jgi:hypothetical protein